MFSLNINFKKICIVVIACLLVACGGKEERKVKYMQEGKQLFSEGKYDKAILSFKNVLQIDPKDVAARYEMAESQSKQGELQGAASQYLAVMGVDAKHLMSRIRMGQIYLMVNQLDNAENMTKEIKAIDPENIEGMVLNAGVLIAKNDTEGAYKQLETVLAKQPDDVQANLLKASLDARSGKIDLAITTLKNNSEKNPTKITPLLMLAKIYTDKKEFDKAQETLEAIIKIEPKELENRKRLALFFAASNKLDDAETTMRTAVKELPENTQAKGLLIDFLVTKRGAEQGITELLPMIKAEPQQYDLRFKLAELEFSLKHLDKGEAVLKEIISLDKLGPFSLKARDELARLFVVSKRLDEARVLIKEVIDENPHDVEALQLRGEFALNDGKYLDAIGDFRAVLVDQPKNVKVLKLLSTAHLLNKEPLLAKDALEKIIEAAPADDAARLELANLLVKNGDGDRAIQQVEELIKVNPKSKAGLEALFKAYVGKKEWDKAQNISVKLQDAYPKEGMGYFLSGIAYQAENKLDASVSAFQKALSIQADAVEPMTQLIKSYLALNQADRAVAKLNEIIKQQPKNFVAYNLMGGVYLNQKKFDEAIAEFKKSSNFWSIVLLFALFSVLLKLLLKLLLSKVVILLNIFCGINLFLISNKYY